MKELNPIAWFGTRELQTVPRHFVKANTPRSDESYQWVLTKLQGRFCISTDTKSSAGLLDFSQYFYFEDSAEAMLYELRWSGHSGNNSLF
jgi:hypothetical protein